MTDTQDDNMDLSDVESVVGVASQAAAGFGVDNRDTDRANAQEFAQRFLGRIIYATGMGWLYYDERRWVQDMDRGQAITMAGELADTLWLRARQQDGEERGTTRSRARRLETSSGLNGMLIFASALIAKPITEFDTNPYLLNAPNGTFDSRTGEDVGRDPTHYITRLCPTPLDLEATDPIWDKVITDAFSGDKAKMEFYQRFMGYSLTGDVREKKFIVICGPTDATKSTISEPFTSVLGDVDSGGYTSVWDAEMMQANSRVNRAEKLNKVRAARFIAVSELEKGSRMADNFVKQYTGGNAMDACAKYKPSYTYRPTGKLLMDTNYVPKSSDPAVHNRMVLMPLSHVPEVIDRSIKKHLDEDPNAHKAMLAWAVRGCMRWWKDRDLGDTPWLAEAKAKYIKDSDVLTDLMDECFDPVEMPEDSVHVDLAWVCYKAWAVDNVAKPLPRRIFGQAMEEHGFAKARYPAKGGTMRFIGIKLKAAALLPGPVRQALWPQNVYNVPL